MAASTTKREHRKLGRPKGSGAKPRSKLRSKRVTLYFTSEEMVQLRKAARSAEEPVAAFARGLVLACLEQRPD